MADDLQPKICDLALCVPARTTAKGAQVLATFTVLARPVRINRCALVKYPGGAFAVWTPAPEIKLLGEARGAVLESAKVAYREALATVQAV